jgi:hypothetical protein
MSVMEWTHQIFNQNSIHKKPGPFFSFPNFRLGMNLLQTPVSTLLQGTESEIKVSQKNIPKREFGNEKRKK